MIANFMTGINESASPSIAERFIATSTAPVRLNPVAGRSAAKDTLRTLPAAAWRGEMGGGAGRCAFSDAFALWPQTDFGRWNALQEVRVP
jgi:hypothetical protein